MTRQTDYGFEWGVLKVTRIASFAPRKGALARILGIDTGHHKIEVIVSKTGRSVRIFRDGVELT